jgi:hypothetical protein
MTVTDFEVMMSHATQAGSALKPNLDHYSEKIIQAHKKFTEILKGF